MFCFNFVKTKQYISIKGVDSCFIDIQHLSIMFVATQLCIYINLIKIKLNWLQTIGTLYKHSLLVLSYWKVCPCLLNFPPEDRDHTDSRRIKPNSRTLLIGEQPNPSKLLPPEDRMSRHRGAKQPRQCVLSSAISLLSLA